MAPSGVDLALPLSVAASSPAKDFLYDPGFFAVLAITGGQDNG